MVTNKRNLRCWLIKITNLKIRVSKLEREASENYPESYGALSLHHTMLNHLESHIRTLYLEQINNNKMKLKERKIEKAKQRKLDFK